MTQFNKGPAYGLSAEVKSKVGLNALFLLEKDEKRKAEMFPAGVSYITVPEVKNATGTHSCAYGVYIIYIQVN